MDSQKLENLLNLALNASMQEREKSLDLDVGYDAETNVWELIVKYNGDLARLNNPIIGVEELIAGYAIVTIPQSLIQSLVELEEIEYVEMPKRLFFHLQQGKEASCILPVTVREPYLTGRDTLVAVIDSGIDYERMDFRRADGSSRIAYLWDQALQPDESRGFYPPEGFLTGVEFNNMQINEALAESSPEERFRMLPSIDTSGHGTSVAAIAAGNGLSSDGRYVGVAPESELIIVKLGVPQQLSFPRTTELMRALTYVVQKSVELAKPISINLSFGNTYGAHDGTSLIERFMDNVSEIGRSVICVGSGNEGAAGGHTAGIVSGETRVELAVAPYERALNVQLWKEYADIFRITLISPGGEQQIVETARTGTIRLRMEQTEVLIYIGEPSPYSINQEIYFDFLPQQTYINSGVWTFMLQPVKIVTGNFYFYLPSSVVLNSATRFYSPTPEITFTIPSTSQKVITVGAYSSIYDAYADFSGRGILLENSLEAGVASGWVKPDIVAPGVDISISNGMGGTQFVTGTSFATPFVTGSAALMMEWGIVRGNDPYLYGEKVKAYLRRGARPLRGEAIYPNPRVGYGALCLSQSLPL
ncbi:S8 family peptidase [Kineothrix sp. MB12-C1]|uniref:S8 family peptidase n=1 Tax=Kineothrix sp. MB12-C1 TaxID=3070215 RepID=UPI0027D24491|nr:S8 family peptidase [Kineothrix sp. MB12-C1]WMC93365.1 S8 family peptidase [Kineothrix sp. MB12-C1]